MKTPAPMTDLRHVATDLPADEKSACRRAGLAQKARAALGSKWLMARENAPARGVYNPLTGAKVA